MIQVFLFFDYLDIVFSAGIRAGANYDAAIVKR